MQDKQSSHIFSPLLSSCSFIKHAFFTRNGGVSKGEFASFNVGENVGDDIENVLKNQKIAESYFKSPLILQNQIHSGIVNVINTPPHEMLTGDAIVTNAQGLTLGIKSADCTPILFVETVHKIIGVAHAGWRSAISENIIQNTINAMEKLGGERKFINAATGPCIQQKSYEVGEEILNQLKDLETRQKKRFDTFIQNISDKYYFDLPGFIFNQLQNCDIKEICVTNLDTFSDDHLFFSHRRTTLQNKNSCGRQLSAICIV